MISSNTIRQDFINYFVSKGHTEVASSPVVPIDDNTLLFANAGMNQFKSIFLGQTEPDVLRAVNSQKCIRAGGKHNDLEEVGKDGYHHTFFEMLGNWSFGDYYKKEAITWAWELLTVVWQLPKEKLFASVHDSDAETFELWKDLTDIANDHISYHGDKDNFWEMGETGPCGPCSEIHLDRGIDFCELQHVDGHSCAVNGDCSRYIELWNLVFIQYFRDETGALTPLKNKYVDTGAGLERVCQILQGKKSNYDTDLFVPIIEKIAELSSTVYSEESGVSHRVIADHIRTLCFALADGGFPSNEGRGYVLRRILRRGARHGRLLGFKEPFMWKLVDTVCNVMGGHYSELLGKGSYLKMVIKSEEERFNQTLDKGLEIFNEIVKNLPAETISGKDAFMLYDTYGFPLDLTTILADEINLKIDLQGFETEMEAQRNRARKASKFTLDLDEKEWIEVHPSTPTEFIGYELHSCDAVIQRYALGSDGKISIQLDRTVFYAESGGQIADTGTLKNDQIEIEIENVVKIGDAFIHNGRITKGGLEADTISAEINTTKRKATAANHTCTHLLHTALRQVLGDHVQQKGSYVTPDYFRFDFTHIKGLGSDEILQIEQVVNETIREDLLVVTEVMPVDEARKAGAMALFGEKYQDEVRVVSVGAFSKELCGGTHATATGNIGMFKIRSESSTAAGIRRIEAITGRAVEEHLINMENEFKSLASRLQVNPKQLSLKLDQLLNHVALLELELKNINNNSAMNEVDKLMQGSAVMSGVNFICQKVESNDIDSFRAVGDIIKDRAMTTIAVLFSVIEGKVSILCVVSKDLGNRFHAGKIVGQIALIVDGKGGGRPDSAMAGGKNIDMIDEAIKKTSGIIFG
ncbi:MAG: alanine--tRNA ligase [Candidatus Cloacimonetes bacterium HGW-Cloacimonetes-1]|jgi:alanyl-tRNA synthetase|nr:MAG: alanine--tRNA ligase [Candidatus Cloacimonetes bacterium HGW-Cloacimonetes-1]